MDIVNGEWTLLDKKNGIVEKTYTENGEKAIIEIDVNNDNISVKGNLFRMFGYKENSIIDKDKYNRLLSLEKIMAKKLLDAIKE